MPPRYLFRPSAPTAVPTFHRLDPAADARFLRARVADPLTGVAFRPTNEVVLCATCGQVSLRETWEAVGGCPNGHDTPAAWDVDAALAAGDGAAGRLPTRPAAPPRAQPVAAEPERSRAVPLLLAVLGVAVLVVGGLFAAGLFTSDDEEPVETVEAAPTEPTGPEAVAVQVGTVEGSLAETDFRTENGRFQDLYTFAADSSGRVLSFTVASGSFYPDLYVETPEGDRVEAETVGDDDEGVTRTVAVRGLRGPGLYRVFISSRRPDDTGAYELRVKQEEPVRPLTANAAAFSAELGEFSQQVDGFYRDRYTFAGAEGREHVVTVRSSAFAPTVAVTGPGGAVTGSSGRAGGSVTFTFTPAQAGTHTLVVSSQSRDQRGAYTVQLAVAPEREAEPEGTPLPTDGRAVTDSLAAGDTQIYRFPGRLGDRVRIEVRADGFTPTLTLVGPDGSRTPAAPDGDRARVRTTLPSSGVYRVLVGASGGSGEVRVTLEREAAVTADDIPRLPGADLQRQPPAPTGGQDYRPQPIDGDGR